MASPSVFNSLDAQEQNGRIFPPIRLTYKAMSGLIGLTEAVVIIAASILGQTVYQHVWLGESGGEIGVATGVGLMAALTYVSLGRWAELYRLPQILHPGRSFGKLGTVWAFSLLMLTAILFLLKVSADLSRGAFFTFSLFELPLLLSTRVIAAEIIKRKVARDEIAGRPAIVIGNAGELGQISAISLLHRFGFKEVGRVILDPGQMTNHSADIRLDLENAISLARQSQAEEFVVAVGWDQSGLLSEITAILRNSPLPVQLLPDHVVRSTLKDRRVESPICSPLTVELQRAPMSVAERGIKRSIDLLFSLAGIIVFMPLLVIAALAIKLDSSGPVIFRQRRKGFNEHPFSIFKFRTMTVLEDGHQIKQAEVNDHRVTRVGRVLRRASIDELPQLFNVLKGDMSLVGPRPHAMAHDDQYKSLIETYCFRHHVKPGITGWAQINGLRGETAHLARMQKRVEFDLWYINNWSFWLDIQVMFRTCFEVLKREAY
jgi:Undecaprenyl-phosphate glucose phosphotransferase